MENGKKLKLLFNKKSFIEYNFRILVLENINHLGW